MEVPTAEQEAADVTLCPLADIWESSQHRSFIRGQMPDDRDLLIVCLPYGPFDLVLDEPQIYAT